MGASLALALRGKVAHITGVARREETAREAVARGVVEVATTDFAAGVADADVIVLAAPVRTIITQLCTQQATFKPGAVITDLGSTKTEIVRAMDALPEHLCAVGSHPMCGKEVTGLDAADAGLYRGKRWILTRTARSDERSFGLVRQIAEAAGAVTLELDPARHDMLVAFASHLPYALAVSLVTATDMASSNDAAVWQVTASGFRDTSRVAASDVTMMLDILLTNTDAVANAIRDFQFALDQMTALLERKDEEGLRAYLAAAAQARKSHAST
ncbi:MAG: prephenate dehydrogenase/arogenate dehydrogenase family protein [Chloroflexi bacterium]|nr:prephenate dehydrogenase/arogenate dehydrogenase family protein [Chloroflexota bacterium]